MSLDELAADIHKVKTAVKGLAKEAKEQGKKLVIIAAAVQELLAVSLSLLPPLLRFLY
jgi:hypothetical protein